MKSQTLRIILLVALTALVTVFITCYFCKKKGHNDIPDKDRSTTICMDYQNDPAPLLTTEMVKSMVGTYATNQLYNIQNATTNAVPNDARAIWFDLETLKKFLYHIEHNVGNNYAQSQGKKIGVRIYYSAYPKNTEMRELSTSQADPNFTFNPSYENKHTLVMIPTISGADGANYDFNPLDVNTYNGFVNMDTKNKYSFINSSYSTLILGPGAEIVNQTGGNGGTNNTVARNHGALTPPDNIVGSGF